MINIKIFFIFLPLFIFQACSYINFNQYKNVSKYSFNDINFYVPSKLNSNFYDIYSITFENSNFYDIDFREHYLIHGEFSSDPLIKSVHSDILARIINGYLSKSYNYEYIHINKLNDEFESNLIIIKVSKYKYELAIFIKLKNVILEFSSFCVNEKEINEKLFLNDSKNYFIKWVKNFVNQYEFCGLNNDFCRNNKTFKTKYGVLSDLNLKASYKLLISGFYGSNLDIDFTIKYLINSKISNNNRLSDEKIREVANKKGIELIDYNKKYYSFYWHELPNKNADNLLNISMRIGPGNTLNKNADNLQYFKIWNIFLSNIVNNN